jgi:mannose-6-phosphate isomerase
MHMELYPFILEPIFKQKVWGGRRIASLGKALPGDGDGDGPPIGESWELADLPAEAATEGEARSRIANGELAGSTLHDAMQRFGPTMMGRLRPTDAGDFPILLKYLDAAQTLSVQVHPTPQYVADNPGAEAHVKHEAWYVLQADEGAVIYKGVREGVGPDELRAAVESRDDARVIAAMNTVPVKPGDLHYLPSGTCHALGAGVLVAEVQTPSDTTFRVYDWGRGREVHVEQAMRCIRFEPPRTAHNERRSHVAGMFTTVTRLCLCDHFRIEKVRMTESYQQEIPYDQPAVWMVLQGAGRITADRDSEPVAFKRGDTVFVPANMDDAKVALDEDTTWLEVTFPQAQAEQIA